MTSGPRRIAPLSPVLPTPSDEYERGYMQRLVNALQGALHNLEQPATARGGWLNLSRPRYDAYGLTQGDIYIDVNVLKITRVGDYGALGGAATISVGTVTVTT